MVVMQDLGVVNEVLLSIVRGTEVYITLFVSEGGGK
jgi:hypothetical protein